jgi:hypothetical protein
MKSFALSSLCLSFRPLLALRIPFLECDVFFFGTASNHGGNSSRIDSSRAHRVRYPAAAVIGLNRGIARLGIIIAAMAEENGTKLPLGSNHSGP